MAQRYVHESFPCLRIERPVLYGIDTFVNQLQRNSDYFGGHISGLVRRPRVPEQGDDPTDIEDDGLAYSQEVMYASELQVHRPEEARLVLYRHILHSELSDVDLAAAATDIVRAPAMQEIHGVSVNLGLTSDTVNATFDEVTFSDDTVCGRVLSLNARKDRKEARLFDSHSEICEQAVPATTELPASLLAHEVPSIPVARLQKAASNANEERFCDIVNDWLPVRLSIGRIVVSIGHEVGILPVR